MTADSEMAARQRQHLKTHAGGHRLVGLSWRSRNAVYGAPKSLALMDMLPVLRRPGIFWVDLQYGDTAVERSAAAAVGAEVWRDSAIDPLRDMNAAAAQVAALDLVITTSNTTAHLAGAVGVPTWLLLPAPGFGLLWYWFLDRADSPFYPSMRCFRQLRPGDWPGVVSAVGDALDLWREDRSGG